MKFVAAHPKLRLFISQVGLQSCQEATYYGVPVVAIPMFADQDFLARKLEESGAGLSLEFNDITYDYVYDKLKAILTNSRYAFIYFLFLFIIFIYLSYYWFINYSLTKKN